MVAIAVKLPAALERFVSDQVKQGAYPSREAAIVAAVEGQRRRAKQHAWLEREVQKGIDALDGGRVVPFDPEDIKRRGRARLAARKKRTRG